METEKIIVGIVFLSWGLFSSLKPEKVLAFRTWSTQKIYGAVFKPSKKTIQIQRFMGIVFVIMGLLVILIKD